MSATPGSMSGGTYQPLVSVVIPVHNGGPHLREAVKSALAQDYRNIEVVVIDNASTDGCIEQLQDLTDDRLVVQRHQDLVPASANWTRATLAAKGEYVKLLCADDLIEPGCVGRQATILSARPRVALVCGRRRLLREDGTVLKDAFGLAGLQGLISGREAIRKCVRAGGNLFGEPACVMFRTPALLERLPWSEEAGYVVDLEMYFAVLRSGQLWADSEVVASFRVSLSSWSAAVSDEQARAFDWLIDQQKRRHPGLLSTRDVVQGHLASRVRSRSRALLYALERRRSASTVGA